MVARHISWASLTFIIHLIAEKKNAPIKLLNKIHTYSMAAYDDFFRVLDCYYAAATSNVVVRNDFY